MYMHIHVYTYIQIYLYIYIYQKARVVVAQKGLSWASIHRHVSEKQGVRFFIELETSSSTSSTLFRQPLTSATVSEGVHEADSLIRPNRNVL